MTSQFQSLPIPLRSGGGAIAASELSPAHQLRDGLPPYIQVIGTADKVICMNSKMPKVPTYLWFMEYEGGVMVGWGPVNTASVKSPISCTPTAPWIPSIMAQRRPHRSRRSGRLLSKQASSRADPFDTGGSIEAPLDDGKPGMSIVTATSTNPPSNATPTLPSAVRCGLTIQNSPVSGAVKNTVGTEPKPAPTKRQT